MTTARTAFFKSTPSQHTEVKPSFLDNWIAQHKDFYVSHAIWANNVGDILNCGSLNPAEKQLKMRGKVSYEMGTYGSRATNDISQLIKKLQENKETLPKKMTVENKISLMDANGLGIISNKQFEEILQTLIKTNPPYTIKLNDNKDYPISCETKEVDFFSSKNIFILGIPKIQAYDGTYKTQLAALKDKYREESNSLQLALDLLSDNSIDKQLAVVWNIYSQLTLNGDNRAIARELHRCRNGRIDQSTLNVDIRAGYNSIWWHYGDVVVLRGNPKQTLGIMNEVQSEDLGVKNYRKGQEVFLLSPFENNGEYFSLDLSQDDTIVIGPKKILAKHQKIAKNKNVKLFNIEDMSQSQLEFFNVPDHLQAKKKPVASKFCLCS